MRRDDDPTEGGVERRAEADTEEVERGPEAPLVAEAPEPEGFDEGARPLAIAALVTALGALASWFAFEPSGTDAHRLFLTFAFVYVVLGAVAVLRLRAQGELAILRLRRGDLSVGALVAFLLYGMGYAFHALVTAPAGPREAWVVRVYMALGDPLSDSRHFVAAGAAALGALEELTWRGWVFPSLEARFGSLRAALASVVLFAAVQIPTTIRLADPTAGLNPLLVVAALGCGAAWTYLRWRLDRLVPVMLSHALFSWGIVEFPLWIR